MHDIRWKRSPANLHPRQKQNRRVNYRTKTKNGRIHEITQRSSNNNIHVNWLPGIEMISKYSCQIIFFLLMFPMLLHLCLV